MEKHPHTEALERMKELLKQEAAKFTAVAESYNDAELHTWEHRIQVVWNTRRDLTYEFLYLLDYLIDQSGEPLEEPPR